MYNKAYLFTVSNKSLRFDFVGVGKNIIAKSILYTETDVPGFFSMALVDIYSDGSADD